MADKDLPAPKDLREKAEKKLNSRMIEAHERVGCDPKGLIHELQVHQIEIEVQNEELRDAMAQLEESRAKYSDLYDFAPVSYLSLDERGIIIEANLTAATQFQMERATLLNTPFTAFVEISQRNVFRSFLSKVFLSEVRQTCELELVSRTGPKFFSQLDFMFARDARGKAVCRISVTDITERKKAEKELQAYAAKLKQSNKALDEFAFIASHDLLEPLRKVRAFADRIMARSGGCLDDQSRDYLERMVNATKRMQSMIKGLLDYSRIGAKAQPSQKVDLTALIRETAGDLEILTNKVGGSIVVDSLPHIEAEPNQMRRLFQNLIENALKFHREESPTVRISGNLIERCEEILGNSHKERCCKILVEDNGIGFDDNQAERIFNLFQRLHGRGEFEGEGLGLAICRKIVERHGGSISAKSKPGEGSTFIITLPIKQGSAP